MINDLIKRNNKYFILITMYFFIGVFYYSFTQLFFYNRFSFHIHIPIYFTIIGLILSRIMFKLNSKYKVKKINSYMIIRSIKLISTISFALIVINFSSNSKPNFLRSIFIMHMFYLVCETYLFYIYNKEIIQM